MGRASWPESRTPPLIAPTLDAVGGRSYTQAIQTPGVLGGRRGRETFYVVTDSNVLKYIGHQARIYGSPWRIVSIGGRVGHWASSSDPLLTFQVTIYQRVPVFTILFQETTTIPLGFFEAIPMVIPPGLVAPVGYLVQADWIGPSGTNEWEQLTVEVDYRAKAVGQ